MNNVIESHNIIMDLSNILLKSFYLFISKSFYGIIIICNN